MLNIGGSRNSYWEGPSGPSPVMWPRSWRLGLETVSRHTNVSSRTKSQMPRSRLGLVDPTPRSRLGLGSERLVHMSIIYTFWNCWTTGSYKLHSERFAVPVNFGIFFILYLLPIVEWRHCVVVQGLLWGRSVLCCLRWISQTLSLFLSSNASRL